MTCAIGMIEHPRGQPMWEVSVHRDGVFVLTKSFFSVEKAREFSRRCKAGESLVELWKAFPAGAS